MEYAMLFDGEIVIQCDCELSYMTKFQMQQTLLCLGTFVHLKRSKKGCVNEFSI